ncbi:MAG: ABC transporter ATP-binding protein [Erysipelothrix sp.]|nr:ABC transporter ATP-binding protein [Erysipelothrix sp.]
MNYLKGYKFRAFIGVLFKLIEAIFELILPFLMVALIDNGIKNQDLNMIYILVVLMGVMSLLGYLSSLVCQYNASIVSQGVGGKLRSALMKKINTFSNKEMDQFGASTLVNRMVIDINQIQLMVAMTIRLAVRAPILMIGSIFALYNINAKIALSLLIFFPVFIIVIITFMYLSSKLYKKVQVQTDKLVNKISEVLSGIRIVRSFSRADDESKKIQIMNEDLEKKTKVLGIVTTLSSPITSLLMNLVMLILIYQGSLFVNLGTMTQGQMVAIINYCTQLVLALLVFMNLVMIYSRGIAASNRVKEVLHTQKSITVSDDAVKDLGSDLTINFDNVSFSYPGESYHVVSNMSFIIKPNTMVGFIGLTGSAKSTLMYLLMRYYDVSEGAIYINDINIKDIDLYTLREKIGYATQSAQFIQGTLFDNVAMGKDVDVAHALRMAQAQDILDKGLDSEILAYGSNLSGGQKQRVNIARALAKNPAILILDDSLSALDYLTDQKLRTNIQENYKNMTSIVITQRTTSLQKADTIYVLEDGQLKDAGDHDSLLKRNKLYQEIHETQVRGEHNV